MNILFSKANAAKKLIACVSVSVGFGSKASFGVLPARKMGREPSPPPSFTRSIFRAVFLCSPNPTESLATQAKKLTSFHSALKSLDFVLKSSIRKKALNKTRDQTLNKIQLIRVRIWHKDSLVTSLALTET